MSDGAGRHGFSLAEIIVATIVMTMLMISVIAYIQQGGRIWQAGYNKISNANYVRMTSEIIRHDLMLAISIASPAVPLPGDTATPSSYLRYKLQGVAGSLTVQIENGRLMRRSVAATTHIARNVASFSAVRLSPWTVRLNLQLFDPELDEDGNERVMAAEVFYFLAPGAGE